MIPRSVLRPIRDWITSTKSFVPSTSEGRPAAILRVVTIDGPAGAGKTSVARAVAEKLGFRLLDTGAMYRAVALAAVRADIPLADEERLGPMASSLRLEFDANGHLSMNGEDISVEIRTPEITRLSSPYSAVPSVREAMSRQQRSIGERGEVVCEGRDMGTVVFPDAAVKIYLDAKAEVRARRRVRQMAEAGTEVDYEEILEQIVKRDQADSSRAVAPLQRTPEQTYIESSEMTKDQVVDEIHRLAVTTLGQDEAQKG